MKRLNIHIPTETKPLLEMAKEQIRSIHLNYLRQTDSRRNKKIRGICLWHILYLLNKLFPFESIPTTSGISESSISHTASAIPRSA